LGGTVIDCDAVYHEMLTYDEAFCNAINERFPGVFDGDGKLNRQKLGQEVFAQKDRLEQLNEIVYRFLVPELKRRIDKLGDGLYAIDAINLFESGLNKLCDRTIAVTAPVELRVRRIMQRDNITEQYARLRISAQKQDEFYRGKCDCELTNAAETPEEFREDARMFLQRLIEDILEEKRRGAN
jgi:L-threonylcarbamoyladenylate synthase